MVKLITVLYPIGSNVRIVKVPPGADPEMNPLLAQSGLVMEPGSPIMPAPNGISGVSDRHREFLTTLENDLTLTELETLALELNEPPKREEIPAPSRDRLDHIHSELDDTPNI